MKPDAVVTGESAGEESEEASLFSTLEKPAIVFVADPTISLADYEKLSNVVFANEKIGLAMKAFRAIRISPEGADQDPILAERGKGVPRLLVVDPVKEKVKVFEENKIKVSGLYSEMKKVAGRCYKEKLDKVVKAHLKLLTKCDQVSNEVKILREKEGKLSNEGKKGVKKLEKVRKELAGVEKELEELATEEREMWKLTPKKQAA